VGFGWSMVAAITDQRAEYFVAIPRRETLHSRQLFLDTALDEHRGPRPKLCPASNCSGHQQILAL